MFNIFSLKKEGFGLDLSDRSLKILKLEKKGRSFRLASFGDFSLEEGLVKNGEIINEERLVAEIKGLLSSVQGERLKTRNVVASLPEEKAFLQVIQMPKMSEEDLAQAVKFEAEKYIPVPNENVYLDFQNVKPVVDNLDHKDILIAAIPKVTVDSYFSLFKKAGLKPVAFEIESQSIARAVIEGEKTENRVLIVDIGAKRTKFILFAGHTIRFISSSLVSSSTFNKALSERFGISTEKAELLKESYGVAQKTKITFKDGKGRREVAKSKVFEALLPALSELLAQIENCMEYYRSHASHEHLPPGGGKIEEILLCGGGANLKALEVFLSKKLGVSTRRANPWVNVFNSPKNLKIDENDSLKYTSAIGLALREIK